MGINNDFRGQNTPATGVLQKRCNMHTHRQMRSHGREVF